MSQNKTAKLITDVDVRVFFQEQLQDAVSNQSVTVSPESLIYLSNMLVVFMQTEHLYQDAAAGRQIQPLALIYADAVNSASTDTRNHLLQRLGDIALFVSGLYAASLNRSLVDVDYYAAMGGSAYYYLAETRNHSINTALKNVFAELATGFITLIDVLSEVGENNNLTKNHDLLRLYELWLKTGSPRLQKKLQALSIFPMPMATDFNQ